MGRSYTDEQIVANRARSRAWQVANPERARERKRQWLAANREKARAQRRALYYKDHEQNRIRARELARRPEKREDQRWQWIERAYGLTRAAWEELFASQGNRCGCCGTHDPENKNGWHTDHDHSTGKVRGILCQPCNHALGAAREKRERLFAAVRYLEKHQ